MDFTSNLPQLLGNFSQTIFNRFPAITNFQNAGFDDMQKQYIIGILATSAITAVGGLIGCIINRNANFRAYSLLFSLSALGTMTFLYQYQFLNTLFSTPPNNNN